MRASNIFFLFFILAFIGSGSGSAYQQGEEVLYEEGSQEETGLFIKIQINDRPAPPEQDIRYWVFPKERPNALVATGRYLSPDGFFVPVGEDIYTVRVRYGKIAGKPFLEKENIYAPAAGQVNVVFNMDTGKLKISAHSQGMVLKGYEDVKVWVFKHPEQIEQGFYGTVEDNDGLVVECETGTYDVKVEYSSANARPVIWERKIVVEKEETVPLIFDFPMGEIFLTVEDPEGHALSGWTRVRYWAVDNLTRDEVVYGTVEEPAGKAIVLPPGVYDLRVQFSDVAGSPEKWLTAIEVRADETVRETVRFTAARLMLRAEAMGRPLAGWKEIACWIMDQLSHEEIFYGTIAGVNEEMLIREGTYDIKFQFNGSEDKETQWVRGVRLKDGTCEVVEVYFAAGYLDLDVFAEGRPLYGMREVQFWLYTAPLRKEIFAGTLERPPAENRFVLKAGTYLLRVQNRTAPFSPVKEIQDIVIRDGEATAIRVDFP